MGKGQDSKPRIGIFGRRNVGKSSIINKIVGQDIAIVSDVPGTTTDSVRKTIEIPGVGPILLIDTAGIDDLGELGSKRVVHTFAEINQVDVAILVISENLIGEPELNLIGLFQEQVVPFFIIHNKSDIICLNESFSLEISQKWDVRTLSFSIYENDSSELINQLREIIPASVYMTKTLVGDILKAGDVILLITPVDTEAPEGRLILPQVQVIRDILDNDCIAVVVKERELDAFIEKMNPKPALAITDSQVFLKADASIPRNILLTSFSIILARHKGDFNAYLRGTPFLSKLKNGDRLLIMESCTHHVSCDDIGRVKLPRWISNYCGKNLEFDIVTGLNNPPRDINAYSLVIQCGGCMLTRRQIISRLKPALDAGIPVTNYGMTIAWIHGIFERAVAPFANVSVVNDYL